MFLKHFYKDSNSVFYALCDKNIGMNSNMSLVNIRKSKLKNGLSKD